MFDIDHFKSFNDTHGHQEGNRVLQKVAELLKRTGRRGDVVARYGGEEFVALLYGAAASDALALRRGLPRRGRGAALRGRGEPGPRAHHGERRGGHVPPRRPGRHRPHQGRRHAALPRQGGRAQLHRGAGGRASEPPPRRGGARSPSRRSRRGPGVARRRDPRGASSSSRRASAARQRARRAPPRFVLLKDGQVFVGGSVRLDAGTPREGRGSRPCDKRARAGAQALRPRDVVALGAERPRSGLPPAPARDGPAGRDPDRDGIARGGARADAAARLLVADLRALPPPEPPALRACQLRPRASARARSWEAAGAWAFAFPSRTRSPPARRLRRGGLGLAHRRPSRLRVRGRSPLRGDAAAPPARRAALGEERGEVGSHDRCLPSRS